MTKRNWKEQDVHHLKREERSEKWSEVMQVTDNVALSSDEKAISLFQLDVLLADQFAATFRPRGSLELEMRLILPVLEEAVHCFQKYISASGRRSGALFRDAEEWIMEENSDWPFSFENSCLALGLSPGYVRLGLLRWRGQKIAQRQNRKTTTIFQHSHYTQHCNGGRKRAGARNVYHKTNTTQLRKRVSQ